MLLTVLLAALSGAPPPLTEEEVIASVARHHPAIAVVVAERAAVVGERLAADGVFDPNLRGRAWAESGTYENGNLDVGVELPTPLWGSTFSGGWRLGLGKIAPYEKADATDPRGELRAGVAVPLWRNGPIDRRRAHIARMALEEEIAQHGVDAIVLELARTAAQRYWEWVAREERLRVAEDLERLAEDRAGQLAQRVAVGDLPVIERIDNDRLVASRQQRVVLSRRALEQAAIELALFLRDDSGAPLVVGRERAPRLVMPPSRDLDVRAALDRALARRPELLRAAGQLDQASVELRWADNQLAPSIDVFGELRQGLGPAPAGGGAFGPAWGKTDALGGVSVEVPSLFRQARGRVAAASAQRARAEEHKRLLTDRVSLEVQDAWSALVAADERARLAFREVEAAVAVENAERDRFNAGDSTILQVNLREQATADARVVAVEAVQDAWRARVQLDAATAALLDGVATRP